MIQLTCKCGKSILVDEKHAGRKGRCRGCGQTIAIPAMPVPSAFPLAAESNGEAEEIAALITDVDPFIAPAVFEDDDPPPSPPMRTPPPLPVVAPSIVANGLAAMEVQLIEPRFVPPEPWFYGFIESIAWLMLVLGLLGCAYGFFVGIMNSSESPSTATTIVIGSSVSTLLVFATTAPILLGVDAARHIRAIRFRVTG